MRSRVLCRAAVCLLLTSFTLFVCGCAVTSPQAKVVVGNPAPALSLVSPAGALTGSSAMTIAASGGGFESASTIMWNGTALTTTYVSSATLTAQVPASDLATTGTATVTVSNPAPGGGTSGGVTFTIQSTANPAPTLSSISPNAAVEGSSAITLTATGTNFISSSTVLWNGTALSTSYTNATTLTAQVPASALASTGTATVTVMSPAPGGGVSGGATFTIQSSTNPAPTLTSISPNSAPTGSPAITLTATGTNFVSSSVIDWNSSALVTTYVNSTTLTAQVPATDLATAGSASVTVMTPTPGGGTSSAVSFGIGAGLQVVNVLANDLAWDPVNSVIYLSLPSTDTSNANSVQILNPTAGTLGTAVSAGSEPNLLSVSATSQYLYVSQSGASTVQALTLPTLGSDYTINLGSVTNGSLYALDLQADPNADGTVAIVLGLTNGDSPAEEGGVYIYDSGTARANYLCGFGAGGCSNSSSNDVFDSIQWSPDGSQMFAANNETESGGFDFYTIPVNSSGFGTVTDYANLLGFPFSDHIHYDAPTGYVYDDNGQIVNPSTGTIIGTFALSASGFNVADGTPMMVPDGTLGAAFFLGQLTANGGTSTYTIQSFDITTFATLNTYSIPNVVGTPTHLIRWGTNGLAFTTIDTGTSPPTGDVYLISGTFVSRSSAKRVAPQSENVRRTWKPNDPFHARQSQESTR